MKCFITVDISDIDFNDPKKKSDAIYKIDKIRTISLELINIGVPIQLKITNLPIKDK